MFKEIIAALIASVSAMREKANAALKDLPPIEQVGAANEVGWAIKGVAASARYLLESAESFEGKIKELETMAGKQVDEAVAAQLDTAVTQRVDAEVNRRVEAGELLTKAAHTSAIDVAVSAAEGRVRQEVTAEREREQTIASRRKEVAGVEGMTAAAAELMSVEALGADDYMVSAGKVADRLKKVAALGVKDPESLVGGIPVTAEGDAAFDIEHAKLEKISRDFRGGTAPAPLSVPAGGGSTPPVRALF